jgi:glucose/arabinose dehydrogenase
MISLLSPTRLVGLFLLIGVMAACSTGDSGVPASIVVVTTTEQVSASTTTSPVDTTTTTVALTESTVAPVPLAPLGDVEVDVTPVADGFRQPILAVARPGDDRLFVADQIGVVYALDLDTGATAVVLDITDQVRFLGEQGLLAVAFDPRDPGRMVVHYSAKDGATTVVGYRLDSDGRADTGSRQLIVDVDQPASNHNGGTVVFGPDGYLYVALGDGGGANDQFDHGQDPFTLLGTILRIDLDGGLPYAIPPDNPFADGIDGAPEVWAWGLRNPWRMAFDGSDLWVGDVGQGTWEEIDRFPAEPGLNAGWPIVEGAHCFSQEDCDPSGFLAPVFEYRHVDGRCSVTGGVVYRGAAIPDLVGAYLFGDYCTGEIWALRPDDPEGAALLTDAADVFLPPLPGLTSFGIGPNGEVYVLQSQGIVWRLVGG